MMKGPYFLVLYYCLAISIGSCGGGDSSNPPPVTQLTPYELDLATVAQRVSSHGFPKLANNTQVSWEGNQANGFMGEQLAKRLHWYDYVVVDGDFVTLAAFSSYLGMNGSIRAANPDFVVTAYFSPADYVGYEPDIRWRELMRTYAFGPTYDPVTQFDSDLSDGFNSSAWVFKTAQGNDVYLYNFGSYYSLLQNPGQEGMRQHFVDTFNQIVVSLEKVDGIYHDWAVATAPSFGNTIPNGHRTSQIDLDNDGNAESSAEIDAVWKAGIHALYALGSATYPAGFLMTGNNGWFSEPEYANTLQGVMLEDFNTASENQHKSWDATMYSYASYMQNGLGPRLTIVQAVLHLPSNTPSNDILYHDRMAATNAGPWFSALDLKSMRFTLASTLMFDGYFASSNSSEAGGYHAAWWMDEFSVDLSTGTSLFPADETGSNAIAHKGWMGNPTGDATRTDKASITLWGVLSAGKDNGADSHAWTRSFDNALVLVNPTSNPVSISIPGAWRRISGQLDTTTNSGALVTSPLVLPARDGIILIKQ